MPNMTMTKTPMPEQEPNVRNKNFKEVSLGYTAEMAVEEAKRCLHCKKPLCVEGCPVNIRIPEFIAKVAEGDFAAAYEIVTSTNALPALSGRVCPQESQCESKCVRGVKGEPVAIEKRGMTTEGMEQYLAVFKYGMPPHGGLGIGLERLTMKLVGEDNVRETTLFPRDLSRLEP